MLCCLYLHGWLVPPGLGQVSTPQDPSASNPDPILHVEELKFTLEFDAEYQRRTARTDAQFNRIRYAQDNEEYRFRESLLIDSRGHLFGENVVQYDTYVRFGLVQEHFSENDPFQERGKSPDGRLLEYDVKFQILPAGKVSASVYASRLDDRIPRPFLPSLERDRERLGGQVFFNDSTVSMTLGYDHVRDDITSGRDALIDDEKTKEDTFRYEISWTPTEHQTLQLEYVYVDREEQYSGNYDDFKATRHNISLYHNIEFGPDFAHKLDTRFRIEEESGDLARDRAEASTQLRLQHGDDVFTTYKLLYLKEKYHTLRTQTARADFSLTYQPTPDLTGTVGLYAFYQDGGHNADTTEFGGSGHLAYSRENRLGRFSANVSYLHSDTHGSDGETRGFIIDEAITIRGTQFAFLAQPFVEPLSVVVWGPNTLYYPGVDFIFVQSGDLTAIVRLPTGRILSGQSVFVSYTYRTFDNGDTRRDRVDLRLQQTLLDDLNVFYAMSYQNEDITRRRFTNYPERDIQRHRVGFDYRRPMWSFGLELEYNDDDVDPFKAMHVNGDVTFVREGGHELGGRSNLSQFWFDGLNELDNRRATMLDTGLFYRYVASDRFEASASASYRFENNSLTGETHGVDLAAALEYKIGELSVLVEAEYDMLDLPASTDNTAAVWFKVRRSFPVISRRGYR